MLKMIWFIVSNWLVHDYLWICILKVLQELGRQITWRLRRAMSSPGPSNLWITWEESGSPFPKLLYGVVPSYLPLQKAELLALCHINFFLPAARDRSGNSTSCLTSYNVLSQTLQVLLLFWGSCENREGLFWLTSLSFNDCEDTVVKKHKHLINWTSNDNRFRDVSLVIPSLTSPCSLLSRRDFFFFF